MEQIPATPQWFDVHHPHDALVKFILSISPNMADLLTTYLPPPLAEPIFWKECRVEPGSFLSDSAQGGEGRFGGALP